jgi:hypothetical protein
MTTARFKLNAKLFVGTRRASSAVTANKTDLLGKGYLGVRIFSTFQFLHISSLTEWLHGFSNEHGVLLNETTHQITTFFVARLAN